MDNLPRFLLEVSSRGEKMESYNNADFIKVLKVEKHIRMCIVYLEFGLCLPLSNSAIIFYSIITGQCPNT